MLIMTNVRKTFNKGTINEKKALNGIDLTLNDGDFVTVIGGNGAGKSTMLNMIAGVYPIDSGKIEPEISRTYRNWHINTVFSLKKKSFLKKTM